MLLDDQRVFLAKVPKCSYEVLPGVRFPELDPAEPVTTALVGLRELMVGASLDAGRLGQASWNPLGDLVPPGARVVIKPNWVASPFPGYNDGESLVVHTHVIDALLRYLKKVPECSVTVGDAPIQGCDFEKLLAVNRVRETVLPHITGFRKLEIVDFRRTILDRRLSPRVARGCRPEDAYVLFDLGAESLLEPVTSPDHRFRVTVYNPEHLARTHRPGVHKYLIAKEVLEADVVFNLAKLKTHKKAGITGALKNLVGVNGHKEYLPHHRLGGSGMEGDCYPGRSRLKRLAEAVLDAGNRTENLRWMRAAGLVAATLLQMAVFLGEDDNLEGSWYGNDTVWRMCLDLQRIVHYGRVDGTMAQMPQRRVITITDAIIAGQGEGPLRPSPLPLGLMTLAVSPAAADAVHCYLLGMDPFKVPLIREALRLVKWPLVVRQFENVIVHLSGSKMTPKEAAQRVGKQAVLPRGWRGFCECQGAESERVAQ